MRSIKFWVRSLSADIFLLLMFYLWQHLGYDGAGNVFLFITWVFSVVYLTVGIFGDKNLFKEAEIRPYGFIVYHIITEIILIVSLVWIVYFCLASIRLVGVVGYEAARKREPNVSDSSV